MEINCSVKEFTERVEGFCNGISCNTISTSVFDVSTLEEVFSFLEKDSHSHAKTLDSETVRYITNATLLPHWLKEVKDNRHSLISLTFFWDCDELAFDVSDVNGKKIWWKSEYNTSYLSKRLVIRMLRSLHDQSISLTLDDQSMCRENYVSKDIRKAVSAFVYGESCCTFDSDDQLVRKYQLKANF